MNRNRLFILLGVILLISVQIPFVQPTPTVTIFSFQVFSDTHIGEGVEADGLNSSQRLTKLLQDSGNTLKINLGDLINGWVRNNAQDESFYNKYQQIIKNYTVLEIKGNHDVNKTKFTEKFGSLNWVIKNGLVLFVGVGSLNEDGLEWNNNGVSYTQATYDFLTQTIKSTVYTQTTYHILFMHYAPDSTWGLDNSKGVSARFSSFLKYFNVAFHGHEGGGVTITQWGNTLVVHTTHLGTGLSWTNSYLTASLDTTTGIIKIYQRCFLTNFTRLVCKATVGSD